MKQLLHKNIVQVLKDIESRAEADSLPIIGRERGQILVDVISRKKPKRVLEVGTLVGYSTILIGSALGTDDEITTVELDKDEALQARRNIERSGIAPNVRYHVGDALKILPGVTGPFDVVFIDAEKKEYLAYLRLIEKQLHPGSIVIADNAGLFEKQMVDYLEYVRHSGKYRSRYVPFPGDGVEVSEKI